MTDQNTTYDAAEHETFGFVDDEQPSEEGLVDAIVDAEGYRGADRHGMTPREEREGTPLDERLAAEVPSSPEALGTIGIPDEPGGTPGETDPLQPIPDEPGDPYNPDPVPEPDEPADPHRPDPMRPDPGVPGGPDPLQPIPDEPGPPR